MAKRFIDTNIYDDDWFMALSKDAKLLWIYFITKCNHAGMLKINKKLCEVQTGIEDIDGVVDQLEDRLKLVKENLYFIPKFIEFQYPGFPKSRVRQQASAIEILKEYNLFDENILQINKELNNSSVTLNEELGKSYEHDNGNDNDNGNVIKGGKISETTPRDPLCLDNDILKLFNWIENGKLPGSHERVFPGRFMPKTDKQKKNWLECLDKLHRLDHCTLQEINGAIIFAREDPFWKDNFLSLLKLRDKDKDGVKYIDRFIAGYEKKYSKRKNKQY